MAEPTPDKRITEVPSEDQIDALIKKHRSEIDRILPMNSEDQQKEIAKYDLTPEVLIEHYGELQKKAADLRRRSASANTKIAVTGWGVFAVTAAALFALRKKLGHALTRWSFIIITPIVAGFAGSWLGAKIFGGDVRQEGKALAQEARDAFERELAIAIENKERLTVAQKLAEVKSDAAAAPDAAPKESALVTAEGLPVTKDGVVLPKDGFTADVAPKTQVQPRESFIAEAAKEKAAAQAASPAI